MSNITHPKHYNAGKIEVIEAIEDWKLNFARGNAVKYIARAGKKVPEKCTEQIALEKEIEDLEKARWYVSREIERLKAKLEGREVTRPNDMNPRADSSAIAASTSDRPMGAFPPGTVVSEPRRVWLLKSKIEEAEQIAKADTAQSWPTDHVRVSDAYSSHSEYAEFIEIRSQP